MPIVVTCPDCQARIEIADDLAGQPIRCHRCGNTFDRGDAERKRYSEAIQASPKPTLHLRDDEDQPDLERLGPPPRPRMPFPWNPMLVVIIGILFFLLVFSVGFNIWFLSKPDRFGR